MLFIVSDNCDVHLTAKELEYILKIILLQEFKNYIDQLWDRLPHIKANSEVEGRLTKEKDQQKQPTIVSNYVAFMFDEIRYISWENRETLLNMKNFLYGYTYVIIDCSQQNKSIKSGEAPNEPEVKKGPNWVSVPRGAHFNASCASTAVCLDFRSWNLIRVTGEKAKCNRGRA
ncbi:hypothetical protein ALC56_05900 [Trachymyrmex septentrionalis]|uniref:Uncharacterized protein n=1 Tax=Trachymyrmex septentrionalis TaxID=34720 RepID=A0A151JXE5_9HYME|nr:hypothetical protein ALC56_05900 [Trachymyrmex septentrionalis]